jgi:hypothetical protein
MLEYVGNSMHVIDWDSVIKEVQDQEGKCACKYLPVKEVPELKEIDDALGNYCRESIEWINYYPDKEFSMDIAHKFGNFVKAPRMIKCWISKVLPGKTAPWHWDWDVDWKKYIENGQPIRFTAMINPPTVGHVFIVGDQALYNEKQGDVHKWSDFRSYHAGTNCGLVPKFNFNYLAYAE